MPASPVQTWSSKFESALTNCTKKADELMATLSKIGWLPNSRSRGAAPGSRVRPPGRHRSKRYRRYSGQKKLNKSGSEPSSIPGTKTVHKIPYFDGIAELRNKARHVLIVDCILKRDCNIFTRSGFNTVFQDGEVLGQPELSRML